MPTLNHTDLLTDLAADFELWRHTRTNRKTPQELKDRTLALLEQHSSSEVCGALNLSWSVLSRWKRQAVACLEQTVPQFVELAGETAPTTGSIQAESPIVLEISHQRLGGSTTSIKACLPPEQWRTILQWMEVER